MGSAVPEKREVVWPREREMSNPPREYEPANAVAPVAMMATNSQPAKLPQVVEKIVEEDETKTEEEEITQSSPVQKKKPTKRGLLSAKPAAKPFAFDDDDTGEEEDTTNANGNTTNGKDVMDEAVSKMLNSTPGPPSQGADVVMTDAPAGEDTHMEDPPAPVPAKLKQTAKVRKTPTAEPGPQPQPKKSTKPAKIPTSAEGGDDDDVTEDELEPKALQKRAPAKKPPPAKKPAPARAKKAPEPEPELEPTEEDEEGIDEDDLEPRKLGFKKRPPTKPKPAKGKKAQPQPESEAEEEAEVEQVTLKSKKRAAKAEPTPAPVPESELEAAEEEQDITTSKKRPNGKSAPGKGKKPAPAPEPEPESEVEEEADGADQATASNKRGKPRKKLAMKTSSRTAKKAALELAVAEKEKNEDQPAPRPKKRGGKASKKVPTPEPEVESEPEPEPVPVAKTKGRGKAKVIEEPEAASEPVKPTAKAKGRGKKVVEEAPEPEFERLVTKTKGRGKAPKSLGPEFGESSSQPARRSSTGKAKSQDVSQDDEPPKKKARSGGKAPKLAMPSRVFPRRRGHASTRTPTPEPEEDEQGLMDVDETEVYEAPAPPRRKGKGEGKAPTAAPEKTTPAEAPGSPVVKESRGTQRVIREKPPPAPRQQSVDVEGARRSGRARVAPLQYWKGERAEYALADINEEEDPRKKTMRMPQLVGVIRIESDDEQKPKRRAPAPKKRVLSAGTKRKRALDGGSSDGDSDPGEPDVWEHGGNDDEAGVKKGIVRAFPTVVDDDGDEQMEEVQLAFSKQRMVTVDVANGGFKFVKTFTEDHFGTGIIEIPPGGVKRLKNSGKMHLVFYMLKGRATITIAKNNFRVGKGGQFMVPRGTRPRSLAHPFASTDNAPGNLYSIENEYDTPATMFFAQGCEPDVYEEDGDAAG